MDKNWGYHKSQKHLCFAFVFRNAYIFAGTPQNVQDQFSKMRDAIFLKIEEKSDEGL